MTLRKKVAVAERWRSGSQPSTETAAKRALATVTRRWRSLDEEARELSRHIKVILDDVAPDLIAVYGVGYETAGQLLVTAGDNPELPPRAVLRRPVRHLPGAGLVGPNQPTPPQPRRGPPRKLGAVDDRVGQDDGPPAHQGLHRATDR